MQRSLSVLGPRSGPDNDIARRDHLSALTSPLPFRPPNRPRLVRRFTGLRRDQLPSPTKFTSRQDLLSARRSVIRLRRRPLKVGRRHRRRHRPPRRRRRLTLPPRDTSITGALHAHKTDAFGTVRLGRKGMPPYIKKAKLKKVNAF